MTNLDTHLKKSQHARFLPTGHPEAGGMHRRMAHIAVSAILALTLAAPAATAFAATGKSAAVTLDSEGVTLSNAYFTSTGHDDAGEGIVADGVVACQIASDDSEKQVGPIALLHAAGARLVSPINSGALFFVDGATAEIVLSGTELDFDSTSTKLVVATGSKAEDQSSGDSKDSKDSKDSEGRTASFTAIAQELAGDIEADTASTLDCRLLKSTTWKGAASIAENASPRNTDHLNMSIDPSSTWIVTKDSTVSNLTVAPGARLVDEEGEAVKVADADGNVLVEGASSTIVAVTDEFSTSDPSYEEAMAKASVANRDALRNTFGADVSLEVDRSDVVDPQSEEAEARALELKQTIVDWFNSLK